MPSRIRFAIGLTNTKLVLFCISNPKRIFVKQGQTGHRAIAVDVRQSAPLAFSGPKPISKGVSHNVLGSA